MSVSANRTSDFYERLLSNWGDNYPQREQIIAHFDVIKINKRQRQQKRILLITDKAIYNLKLNQQHSCQRRINLHRIDSISRSLISNEFVLHIPSEYDYHYTSPLKIEITYIVARLCNVNVHKRHCVSLDAFVCTKKIAQQISPRSRAQHYSVAGQPNHDYMRALHDTMFNRLSTRKLDVAHSHRTNFLFDTRSNEQPESAVDDELLLRTNTNQLQYTENHFHFINLANRREQLLVHGYVNNAMDDRYRLQVPEIVAHYILAYSFVVVMDAFNFHAPNSNGDDWKRTNSLAIDIEVSADKKVLCMAESTRFAQSVYGKYVVDCSEPANRDNLYVWRLRVEEMNGAVFVGIHDANHSHANAGCFVFESESANYGIGGRSGWWNVWNCDVPTRAMQKPLQTGDWIDVIVEVHRRRVLFVVNCEDERKYVIDGISVKDEKYTLAVFLSNSCICLKAFRVLCNHSYEEFERRRNSQL